ncbi:MAG TPA: hypothetical protein VEO01_41610, partial [Pseudonocardiaceae bacterium]|nr:hypothetical protein [Pseudonocardiaceae bacterium]
MIQWRRQPEWRGESGPGYDLRQYVGGRPTGLVATTAWQAPRDESAVAGPDVWLVRAPTHVVIGEYRNRG